MSEINIDFKLSNDKVICDVKEDIPINDKTLKELKENTKMVNGFIDGTLSEVYSTVEDMRTNAFSGCTSITSVNLPNVKKISYQAFNGCKLLTSVITPNVTIIGEYAFSGCTSLTSVITPNVTIIGGSALSSTNIINANFPIVTEIGSRAFQSCKLLESANLGKIKNIPQQLFDSCSSLKDVYLGYEGVVSMVSTYAFNNASNTIVHVRSEYADSYATATNWSSLIESGKITIVGDYND